MQRKNLFQAEIFRVLTELLANREGKARAETLVREKQISHMCVFKLVAHSALIIE